MELIRIVREGGKKYLEICAKSGNSEGKIRELQT